MLAIAWGQAMVRVIPDNWGPVGAAMGAGVSIGVAFIDIRAAAEVSSGELQLIGLYVLAVTLAGGILGYLSGFTLFGTAREGAMEPVVAGNWGYLGAAIGAGASVGLAFIELRGAEAVTEGQLSIAVLSVIAVTGISGIAALFGGLVWNFLADQN